MKKRKAFTKVVTLCLILVLVFVMIYSGLQLLGSTVFSVSDDSENVHKSKTILRNGIEYFPRQDITVLLITGIDEFGVMKASGGYNNSGNVDMVTLAIFDQTNEETRLLSLNRDTIVEMPVLGIGGRKAGTMVGQLALSHSFGTGMMDSSENVNETVSNLLYGLHIDHYITANMDAINILNEAVGGVTVEVKDDFSEVDPTIKKGTMTLHGDQAIHYVRSRAGVGNQLNISRMERQKQYMGGFLDAFNRCADESTGFLISTYNKINEYVVTDCSTTVMNQLFGKFGKYPIVEIVSPEGENKIGTAIDNEQHYEFHLDEQKLDDLILRLFYAPKQ